MYNILVSLWNCRAHLLAGLIIFGSEAAVALTVSRADSGELFLYGKSCDELSVEVEHLLEWTRRLGDPTGPVGDCEPVDGKGFRTSIEHSVPFFVTAHHGQHPAHSGPNCFNTVLVLSKLSPSLRHTQGRELLEWLNSPYCRPVGEAEPSNPGDIVLVQGMPKLDSEASSEGLVHAFVHVTDNLSFSKNGLDRRRSFALQETKSVFKTYGMLALPPQCLRRNLQSPDGCSRWLTQYRCQSPLEGAMLSDCMRVTNRKLDTIDHEISHSAMSSGTQLVDLKSISDILGSIATMADRKREKILKKRVRDPEEKERLEAESALWAVIRERSNSLIAQMLIQTPASFHPVQLKFDIYHEDRE